MSHGRIWVDDCWSLRSELGFVKIYLCYCSCLFIVGFGNLWPFCSSGICRSLCPETFGAEKYEAYF